MAALEAPQSPQSAAVKEKRLAVLSRRGPEALVEWLETIDDAQIARRPLRSLTPPEATESNPGGRKWDDAEGDLE